MPFDGCFYPKYRAAPQVHIFSAQVARAQTEPIIFVMFDWHFALLFRLSFKILTLLWNLCIFLYQRDWDMRLSLWKHIKCTVKRNFVCVIRNVECQEGVEGAGFNQHFSCRIHVQTDISTAWAQRRCHNKRAPDKTCILCHSALPTMHWISQSNICKCTFS